MNLMLQDYSQAHPGHQVHLGFPAHPDYQALPGRVAQAVLRRDPCLVREQSG